jgi:DNA adenine methylase
LPVTYTPLRYPGGKNILSGYLRDLIRINGLKDPVYAEPFCGGAGAAMNLLLNEHVSDVYLNDLDPAVYAFWRTCLYRTDDLCKRIERVKLTIAEWKRQRAVLTQHWAHRIGDLGFATIFLNRVNRSGILLGGVIGGQDQAGNWGMDARFNREDLVNKIRQLARFRTRIHVSRLDAMHFLEQRSKTFSANSLTYVDPPYVAKGSSLYENHYDDNDHRDIATVLKRSRTPWVVSYDNCPLIRELYRGLTHHTYSLQYSAHQHRRGKEIIVLSPTLSEPGYRSPLLAERSAVRIARPLAS